MAKRKPNLNALQMPMFSQESDWRPPQLSDLPSWAGAPRVAIDIETCDPALKQTGPGVRRDGFICGVSFALEGDRAYYLPIRHFGGDNMPHDQVLYYLKSMAQEYRGEIVGANFQYDLDYLAEAGIVFPRVKRVRDIQIADPLLYELHNSYSLEAVLGRWGYEGKSESELRAAARDFGIDPKKEMWKLPARHVGPYAEGDVDRLCELIQKQEALLRQQDLWEVYELESKLQPILLKMRRRGVRIDLDKLAEIERMTIEAERADNAEITRRTGVKMDIGDVNKKKIKAAILREIGVRWKETPTGQPKIDKELLEQVDHPIADLLLHAGRVNKIRTTFCKSVRSHEVNGRIHATFNQLRRTRETGDESGAKYGRLSCSDPNLQQQPARDPEYAKVWRSIYVPDEDQKLWCAADYSQQEPRMLVHFAELIGLDGARDAAERYRNDPKTDNHDMMTVMIDPHLEGMDPKVDEFVWARKKAKNIFLGLCYGMGSGKLAASVGLPTEVRRKRDGSTYLVAGPEGQALLDKFDRAVPFVRKMAKAAEAQAKRNGYIKTLTGRRCRFPTNAAGEIEWAHKGLNRLIQGSSADQTKIAMVALDEAGHDLRLQVHDEMAQGVNSVEEARDIAHIMATCVELRVPSRVDIEIGPNWGEAKEID
jgi:DNA polymerase I-like protein with 3'-5' exonuclease and polymerase domains